MEGTWTDIPLSRLTVPRIEREQVSKYWLRVRKSDPVGVALANRHYSRIAFGKQGVNLGPPGRLRCLLSIDLQAVWTSHYPYAEYALDHMDAYRCTMFRNESPTLSSVLIRDAMTITETYWPVPPKDGWITWVAPSLVASRNPGYCFLRAGWYRDSEWKSSRRGGVDLIRLRAS